MDYTEKTIESKEIFKGRILHVLSDKILLPDGKESTREVVRHNGAVCVAPLTENNELLFVRQYRYPYKETLLELPAGRLESYGTPLENGIRELKEETGTQGRDFTFLGKIYPSPGYTSEIIYLYFCRISEYGEQQLDDGEFLDVERIPLEKAVEMALNNEFTDAKTLIGVLKTDALIKSDKI